MGFYENVPKSALWLSSATPIVVALGQWMTAGPNTTVSLVMTGIGAAWMLGFGYLAATKKETAS